MIKTIFFLLITIFSVSGASYIPATNMMTWTPGVTVGVPGGIPERSTIFVNLRTTLNTNYLCAADGVTDDYLKIQNALKACPSNQVVYAPAGTYMLGGRVLVQFIENWTLRGDGQGQTIFLCSSNLGSFEFGSEQFPKPTPGTTNILTVTAGATAGSSNLTLTATTCNVGNFVYLWTDTPTWMHTLNTVSNDLGMVSKMTFLVKAKTATNITVWPPVPLDVSGWNPRIIPWGNAGGFSHVFTGVGLEDFSMYCTNGSVIPIKFQQTAGCWIKNVEVDGSKSRQMFFLTTISSEVRGCYTHGAVGTGPNHEGIDFVNDGCWNLIEDNICVDGGKPAIILGDGQGGCVGNIISYNYAVNEAGGVGDVFNAAISDSHGAGGNMLNVYEGNQGNGFQSDGYYGGSSKAVLIRNHWDNTSINLGPVAIMLNHYSAYFSVVGNVLGSSNMVSAYDSEVNGGFRTLIYRLGYPNAGNGGYGTGTEGTANTNYNNYKTIGPTSPPDYSTSPNTLANANALDLNVKNNILRHGNYDYANNAVTWDSGIADHTIYTSLLYSAAPSWWPVGKRWPTIGPELVPMVGTNYAHSRYSVNNASNMLDSPSETNSIPTISSIDDQEVDYETATGALAFTIGDAETSAGFLTVSGLSSDLDLVPIENIVFGGANENRTVTVTPEDGLSGVVDITVVVTDVEDSSAQTTFVLTINPPPDNTAPTLATINDQVVSHSSILTVPITFNDTETSSGSLIFSATSSNHETVIPANVYVEGTNLIIVPETTKSGKSTIQLTVTDEGALSASRTFLVTVSPSARNSSFGPVRKSRR